MENSILNKKCQFCAEEILNEAEVCKFCHRNQIDDKKTSEIIKKLSSSKKNQIFSIVLVLIAYPNRQWWLLIVAVLISVIREYTIKNELKKVSKVELLEKYEKHLKSKLIYNIIYYTLIIIAVLMVIGYYADTGHF